MSSLAAARADNFYYPQDWRPENGSLNTFHGSHALGKRAKDLASDGVLVVRFEMPFNAWCLHCNSHIGRGVRFNAKKKKVGMYFTTILYEFRLKCALCSGEMVIQTDPQNREYKLVSGLKKQATAADDKQMRAVDEEMGTERLNDPQVGIQAAADPFFKLEHDQNDRKRAAQRARGLESIVEIQEKQFKDDYGSNASLRAVFRQKKKHLQHNASRAEALGLGITLLDADNEDLMLAKATVFQGIRGKASKQEKVQTKSRGSRERDSMSSSSFQFFGDPQASQLNLFKKRKLEELQQQRKTRSSLGAPTAAKLQQDRVAARAKKLLQHR